MKSKTVAAWFAIFLGAIAVDAWYLKKYKTALIYNFVFLVLAYLSRQAETPLNSLLGIVGIVRGIRLFAMDQLKFDQHFNDGNISRPATNSISRPLPPIALSTELSELSKLHQQGSLTPEEFNAAKASLLQKKAA